MSKTRVAINGFGRIGRAFYKLAWERDDVEVVAEYKAGKEKSIQFLVGQFMKESKGSANPQLALEILKELLK